MGDSFGEFALLHEVTRSVTVRAVPAAIGPNGAELWALQRSQFQDIMVATQARLRSAKVRNKIRLPNVYHTLQYW